MQSNTVTVETIRAELSRGISAVNAAFDRFPFSERKAYATWLAQTYYYVRHSTRLLAAAAARFPQTSRGAVLHLRFSQHIREESRHEELCVRDLAALGFSIQRFPERHATRLMYETQYYKVEHQDPIALFGYILPLEALSVLGRGESLHSTLSATFGRNAATFLQVHVGNDPTHLDKAFEAIADCSPAELQLILENMGQTFFAYLGILEDTRTCDEPT